MEPLEGRTLLATALAVDASNNLLRFDTASPGVIASTTPLTGLQSGETVLGLDFRPANGQLYALGSAGRLYTINRATGAATLASTLTADPADTTNPYAGLVGTAFDLDFNPVVDRLRVVSNGGQNLRINVDTGAVTTDAAINGVSTGYGAAAYTNSFPGSTSTTLYGIDPGLDALLVQNPPNNGTTATVGPLGVPATSVGGFDILPSGNTALAALRVAGSTGLYSINLGTGAASLVGPIGAGSTPILSMALAPAGTLSFSAPTYTVVEGQPMGLVTVTRTGGSDGTVTAIVNTVAGTAIPGQDYTDISTTVTFFPGDTAPRTVGIPIIDDANFEFLPNETVNVVLSGPTGGAVIGFPSTATLEIIDNEPRSLSVNDVQVNESAGTATFTVSLNAGSGQTITVSAATGDGTATAGSDYTAVGPVTLTFAPGVTTQTVTVPILNDAGGKRNETFTLTLSNATNALIAHAQGTATIVEDDGPVVAQGGTVTANRGVPVTAVVATFTDPNGSFPVGSYTATVDWGDTTTSAGTITASGGTFTVTGTHTYAASGAFAVHTSITRTGSGTAVALGQAVVTDQPVAINATPQTAVAGSPLNDVLVATISDPGGLLAPGRYEVLVDWGNGGGVQLGRVVVQGTTLQVLSSHTFAFPGTFAGVIRVRTDNGVSVGQSFTTTVAAPTVTVADLGSTEKVDLRNVVVATIASPNSATLTPGAYSATIDWGDGTTTTGRLSGNQVIGSHTYAESGNYPVVVTLATAGNPNVASGSTTQAVADVPITLTAQLDPLDDHGASPSDAITNVRNPRFFGTSEAGSIVRLFAAPVGSGAPVQIGQAVTDAGGSWGITPRALADGRYVITATAVDAAGVTTANTTVLSASRPLVIDTAGPRVVGALFNRLTGQILLSFQDNLSGLDNATLGDAANYQFTARRKHDPLRVVSRVDVQPGASPTAPVDVLVTLNNGQRIRGGTFTFLVRSGGVTDLAGNALDGEFYGTFPSGNGRPGGDFVAQLTAFHNRVFAPATVIGGANPGNAVTSGGSNGGGTTMANAHKAAVPVVAHAVKKAHSLPKGPAKFRAR